MVDDMSDTLSDIAVAYSRARSADRLSSFGDFIALSDQCDISAAKIISREVSDGIIAPSYTPEALQLLARKKAGKYCVLQMDPNYEPPSDPESRTVFGMKLIQARNDCHISADMFTNIVTNNCDQLSDEQLRDLLVATVAVKYTQSNSVCVARDGQLVGVGAGQQSRIHCTRLASDKCDLWWLRHHPRALQLRFREGVRRAEVSNAIDAFVRGEDFNVSLLANDGETAATFKPLTVEERRSWCQQLSGAVISSDAFLPFADNVQRAAESGVKVFAAPAGSVNDSAVAEEAGRLGVILVHTNIRLFHH